MGEYHNYNVELKQVQNKKQWVLEREREKFQNLAKIVCDDKTSDYSLFWGWLIDRARRKFWGYG